MANFIQTLPRLNLPLGVYLSVHDTPLSLSVGGRSRGHQPRDGEGLNMSQVWLYRITLSGSSAYVTMVLMNLTLHLQRRSILV